MRRWYALLTLAVVAVAGVLVWWKPWQSGAAPVVTRARTAFGSWPVVHVLARAAAAARPNAAGDGVEIWYRLPPRDSHFVLRRRGKVLRDVLSNPLQPPSVPPIPEVSATLWTFVTRYRPDLAAGRFRAVAEEPVEGRRVVWLQSERSAGETLDVAIDPVTYQPLWISDGPFVRDIGVNELIQLVTAETIPFDPGDFVKLKQRKGRHL